HVNENSLSFIAICPIADVGVNSSQATLNFPDGKSRIIPLDQTCTVADALNVFLQSFDINGEDADSCGLFGYTAFDAVRYFENIPVMEFHHHETDAPDMYYILYKYLLVFDHFNNRLTVIELCGEGEKDSLREIETLIENRNFSLYDFKTVGERRSTITDDEYKSMVSAGIRHCLRGDVFQIVLSRRFEQAYQGDDFKVYRALRSINPSPYLFYFDFGGFRIFGSSPETHCKITDRRASIDPIAGTAFRTGNVILDRQRVKTLLDDPKENSEHVMLVDLARNDLSRNAHNVKLDFYKEVQYYSHVMHLVSRITGDMNDDADPIKTFIDTFPAGTLSGAPKVRAMQLITELEKHNRGAYGGCIGFIGFNGNLNQAITIRSFVSRSNVLYYQAGAGIVAKSDESRELEEVNSKLGALNKAINQATSLKN
ncbi:MAG: anthranilate synthase component I family protein, partial [Tannerella sp.]|nr:anthranilate synthase component I family protein [Tannerella sp.]